MSEKSVIGGVETLKTRVRVVEQKSPTFGWRAVNMLNKPAILVYSFEPPTAVIYRGFFSKTIMEVKLRKYILLAVLYVVTMPAFASIPSSAYMREQVASQIATAVSTKVDTSATANQTLAGTYTVSGSMNFTGTTSVETAPLPSAE